MQDYGDSKVYQNGRYVKDKLRSFECHSNPFKLSHNDHQFITIDDNQETSRFKLRIQGSAS